MEKLRKQDLFLLVGVDLFIGAVSMTVFVTSIEE